MRLTQRGTRYYVVERVPQRFASVESRKQVWIALNTDSRSEAQRRAVFAISDLENQWQAMLGACSHDFFQFQCLRDVASSRGFQYQPAKQIALKPIDEIISRVSAAQESPAVADAVLGASEGPTRKLSELADLYLDLVKPPGIGPKLTIINDMHVNLDTMRATVYAQSRIFGKVISPPQVDPGKCTENRRGDVQCFHPDAVYLNGSGKQLKASDGTGAWWVKHSWVLGGEGYCNTELAPKETYAPCQPVVGTLLEDGLTMKVGWKSKDGKEGYNLRRPEIFGDKVRYSVTRFGSLGHDLKAPATEQWKIDWTCNDEVSAFDGKSRGCPVVPTAKDPRKVSFEDYSNSDPIDQTPDGNLPTTLDGQSAEILSSFFGLDGSRRIRLAGRRFCGRFSGDDGMPVVFSHELDMSTIQAGDFRVVLKSGNVGKVSCVSLAPAIDPGELRTLLLIGDFGSAKNDPPVRTEVKGNVHSIDGRLNFRGTSVDVTPLSHGPSIAMAQTVPNGEWRVQAYTDSDPKTWKDCPQQGLKQILMVVWNGGIKPANDKHIGPKHAKLYRVTLEDADGTLTSVSPFAIGNLDDNDNNHELCLNAEGRPVSVFFPKGYLVDPNDDVNADTKIEVQF